MHVKTHISRPFTYPGATEINCRQKDRCSRESLILLSALTFLATLSKKEFYRMITPIEFLKLSLRQREQLMWNHGTYLLSKYQERYALHLYSLFDYMIEVWYEVNQDKIKQITPVLDQQKIDVYLKEMSLKDLS